MGSRTSDGRWPTRCSRRQPPLAWWLGSPLALLAGCWFAGLRLNLTGSLPIGLYLVSRAAPVRGSLVLACLPPGVAAFAKERGYVPRGGACPGGVVPVGKPVLAIRGDTVTVTPTGLLVNGAPVSNSRPLPADRRGRPLPQLAVGRYGVGPGELWVVSSYSRLSFDSRYFGAVEAAQVRVSVRRLWTAGPDR
jgi:conjugative transfer signal peptidase TraF